MKIPSIHQIRRGTAAEWDSSEYVLQDGELGLATDTFVVKAGDGSSHWSELEPINANQIPQIHVAEERPEGLKSGEVWIEVKAKE